jgi:hypothetical protein
MVRIKNGENLLKAHRRHIYQLLANEKGIAHWKGSLGYGLLQAAVGLGVLWIKPLGLMTVIVLLALRCSAFFVFSVLVRKRATQLPQPFFTHFRLKQKWVTLNCLLVMPFLTILAQGSIG